MSVIKDHNYYSIHGWMVNKLGLKGNELDIYAIIYGFSQKEDSWYDGNHRYLAEWTSSTLQTVRSSLALLIEKGYIDKKEEVVNGVKFCRYKASFLPTENHFDPSKKFATPANLEDDDPSKKFATLANSDAENDEKFANPQQTIHSIHNNKKYNNNNKRERKVFSKPTLQEIEQYCKEENIKIDAYQFYHYYESVDWMVGPKKMKRWKSAIRTWESREKKYNKNQNSNSNFDNQKNPEGFDELFK